MNSPHIGVSRDDAQWLCIPHEASHMLELCCPFRLLPVNWDRQLCVAQRLHCCFIFSFHLGIRACMDIGHFSVISMSLWMAFVPGDFWNHMLRQASWVGFLCPPGCPRRLGPRHCHQSCCITTTKFTPLWANMFVIHSLLHSGREHVYLLQRSKSRFSCRRPVSCDYKGMADQRWTMFSNQALRTVGMRTQAHCGTTQP